MLMALAIEGADDAGGGAAADVVAWPNGLLAGRLLLAVGELASPKLKRAKLNTGCGGAALLGATGAAGCAGAVAGFGAAAPVCFAWRAADSACRRRTLIGQMPLKRTGLHDEDLRRVCQGKHVQTDLGGGDLGARGHGRHLGGSSLGGWLLLQRHLPLGLRGRDCRPAGHRRHLCGRARRRGSLWGLGLRRAVLLLLLLALWNGAECLHRPLRGRTQDICAAHSW